ncbi:uncharacterized protein LOC123296404 [Chrysoperla carnea]|uniref:uncharacterized protein LOC123296404 n=1 Tax=Chrysoperla carnea TaxID=189513 RepID=UPI001D08797B|nr:uncharacterized protein LOC123296404 [Chrysoperla carnea]
MEFEKNSTKILNLQSCGTNTNTNFMCNNCVRKNDSNYFMPPPFPYFQYPPTNFWEKMYQNEEVSAQCNCQNSKSEYSGSFFSPFPIYLPVFYNPAAHMFTNNNCKQCSSNANCSQSTQTDQCVSIQNNETVYENNTKPKLNYESTKKVFSRKSSFEDNTVGKSSHQLQDRGDKGAGDNENDIDGSEYNSIKNTTKDKFIRICEDKNSYYEKEKSSSEDDDDSCNDNNDSENRLENSTQKEKVKICRNDTPKFCPPAQNETAALCMLSLLTRHKTAMDMAPPSLFQQPQTFPQFKSDCLSRDMKRSELKDSPSDNYLMSPARNNSIHKVPNALQQNDHLKSGSPRAPVKLRTNHNI